MVLPPPAAHGGDHLFLSHCWQHGQDQCATIKRQLNLLLPGVSIFLDVDDLKSGSGTAEVDKSECILVFCTSPPSVARVFCSAISGTVTLLRLSVGTSPSGMPTAPESIHSM